MELFCTLRWRLISAHLSNKFGHCPSWTVSVVFTFLFFKKMGHPQPLFHLFSSSQTNITILTTNIREKMIWPSSIQQRDWNPRPLEHESPPITTRPGLPPLVQFVESKHLFKTFVSGEEWRMRVVSWMTIALEPTPASKYINWLNGCFILKTKTNWAKDLG